MMLKPTEILRRLVRQVGLLVLLTLIGGIAGAVYSATRTPSYTAKALVLVIGAPGDAPTAISFAQAYGRIATEGAVVEEAAATLGPAAGGLSQVTASTSPEAPVIEITATNSTPVRTAQVANAVATTLVSFANQRRDDTRVTASVLGAASVPTTPASPNPPVELAVGAVTGLLVGGLAVLAGVGRSPIAVRRTKKVKVPGASTARPDGGPAQTAPAQFGPSSAGPDDHDTIAADAVSSETREPAAVDGGQR
jgi:capsular polysaccharide biosynthesis protein